MRRQSRLFAIAEYLRGRRTGVTAAQLAERFGVTLRTMYRDLDALREGALPLQVDRGRGGGYALDKNYTLPPVNFTAREAALLLTVARWATELRFIPFRGTLGSGVEKVRAALSASAQRELATLASRLVFTGVPAPAVNPDVLAAVEQAFFEQAPLRIRYRGGAGDLTERTVRVRSVLLDRGFSMLECDDLERGATRNFRLDRIEAVEASRGRGVDRQTD